MRSKDLIDKTNDKNKQVHTKPLVPGRAFHIHTIGKQLFTVFLRSAGHFLDGVCKHGAVLLITGTRMSGSPHSHNRAYNLVWLAYMAQKKNNKEPYY